MNFNKIKEAAGLNFETHIPESISEDSPVLLMLHGYGSHEQDLLGMAPLLPQPFLTISMQAPLELPLGGYAWYHLNFDEIGTKLSNVEQANQSHEKMVKTIAAIKENFPKRELWIMGFSQGCILSYSLVSKYPQYFKAMIGLSGYQLDEITNWKSAEAYSNLKFFISHGTQDPIIPVNLGEQAANGLKQVSENVSFNTYEMGHGVDQNCFADLQRWVSTNYS